MRRVLRAGLLALSVWASGARPCPEVPGMDVVADVVADAPATSHHHEGHTPAPTHDDADCPMAQGCVPMLRPAAPRLTAVTEGVDMGILAPEPPRLRGVVRALEPPPPRLG